jgi:hypothetical protein
MKCKIVFIALFIFILFSVCVQAVEIVPHNEISDYEMCVNFVNEHHEYKLTIMSTDNLFRVNNYYYASKIENNHLYYYSVVSGKVHKYNYSYYNDGMYIHVFEHGGERQNWKWLTDNCNPFYK